MAVRKIWPIVICAVVMLVGTAGPGEATMIAGEGTGSCGEWMHLRQEGGFKPIPAQAWILGYLSGANIWSGSPDFPDILRETDNDSLFAWIDNYCQAHPLEKVADAANQLTIELTKRHLSNP
jgi:hypothetical protein